jgi:RND family efflux transporter MFP subunit
VIVAVGCSRTPAPAPAPPAAAPVVVEVDSPKERSLRRVVEQPGTVQPYEGTKLFARVPGYVRLPYDRAGRIQFDINREVRGPRWYRAADVVAEVVVPELVEETRLKQAMVRQVQAEGEQAAKALAAAEANVEVMLASVTEAKAMSDHWTSQLKKIEGLAKTGVIEDQNRAETLQLSIAAGGKLESARAAVKKARADRDKADADLRAAGAKADVAAADALRSETMLGYAKIRAPYDGIITGRKANTGELVQPSGGKEDWLFTVARVDPMRVVIFVPEADADLVREDVEVKLSIQAATNSVRTGTVARTSWALDPSGRTLRAEIDLPNGDRQLRPGMYVHAQVIRQLPMTWTLPVSAVIKQGDATVCFLVEDGKAVQTPVQIGRSDGQLVEVFKVRKGGAAQSWTEWTGDEKVAVRAASLTDGQAVQVKTADK